MILRKASREGRPARQRPAKPLCSRECFRELAGWPCAKMVNPPEPEVPPCGACAGWPALLPRRCALACSLSPHPRARSTPAAPAPTPDLGAMPLRPPMLAPVQAWVARASSIRNVATAPSASRPRPRAMRARSAACEAATSACNAPPESPAHPGLASPAPAQAPARPTGSAKAALPAPMPWNAPPEPRLASPVAARIARSTRRPPAARESAPTPAAWLPRAAPGRPFAPPARRARAPVRQSAPPATPRSPANARPKASAKGCSTREPASRGRAWPVALRTNAPPASTAAPPAECART